ncbi:class I SAM-dependent methyltransferase [Billgrantia endophytica]|uniref:Methyltransferase type 11 domain-containing protein n=1 Tax=Billgrantia endophytica TaxID=2033802 RepID=A0A2N7TY29_9GAMM|nr:class I SAM-dependent methyltransferase [Halomonas endophytica]PMR73055.1 hypothetical protein C1H69_18930 [Halomonas endophytica]
MLTKKMMKWFRDVRKGTLASNKILPRLQKQISQTNNSIDDIKDSLEKIEKETEKRLEQLDEKIGIRLKKIERKIPKKPKASPPKISFSRLPTNNIYCPVCEKGKVGWVSAYPSHNPKFRMAVVLFCNYCGSGHVPDASKLISGYYEKEYAERDRKDRDIDPEVYFKSGSSPGLSNYFDRANEQVGNLAKLGAEFNVVLDYGSGPGYFLYACKAQQPYAVELDSYSNKYLEYLGAQKLSSEALPESFFDVIVASHVVEHFIAEALIENLKGMLKSLKPGGMLLVEVPNGGHSYMLLHARQDPHTIFFTPQGIRCALELAGASEVSYYARAKNDGEYHPQPIYKSSEKKEVAKKSKAQEFESTLRGGLTVVVKKTQK